MPVVIFVTAYDEYAIRAFEVRALDYVLKPVSQARFDEALARAAARVRDRRLAEYGTTLLAAVADIQKTPEAAAGRAAGAPRWLERIMVKAGEAIQFVEVADIEWIEGADYYVTLHAGGKQHLYRESLKHLEERLDPSQFVRIHVSAIVNLARVSEIRHAFGREYRGAARQRPDAAGEPAAQEGPASTRGVAVRAEGLRTAMSAQQVDGASGGGPRPGSADASRWRCGTQSRRPSSGTAIRDPASSRRRRSRGSRCTT